MKKETLNKIGMSIAYTVATIIVCLSIVLLINVFENPQDVSVGILYR